YTPGAKLSEKTIQIEQPGIVIEPTTMINVPSGKTANFKLLMYNNATYLTDMETVLLLDDESTTKGLKFYIDGAPIGNGRYFVIPAGGTVEKILEVGRGTEMEYDDVKLILKSSCDDIADTITFSLHFTPSCTDVVLKKPTAQWVYNTKLDTQDINGVPERYLAVTIDGFDQNYDNFHHIELQRKTASQSDAEWKPLASFYANDSIFAVDSTAVGGAGVDKIKESDRGSIFYKLFMDGQSDQRYDIRAVSVCMVNGQPLAVDKVQAESEIHSGIKDMYNPRLFGAAQPADGILDVEDEIRLNFNEPIAAGLLTKDNFQVRGIRNGTVNNHSTSVRFDGINDYADTEFSKNLTGKDITVEMWIQPANLQNATLFSQGNINNSLELSLTADNKLALKIGETTATSSVLDYSPANPNYADGSWAHVALVYNAADNTVSAYYNLNEVISQITVPEAYSGIGNIVIGKSIATDGGNYAGKIHNVRVWEKAVNSRNLQLNSNLQLAGIEEGLMAYYPMTEGRGETFEDKARGATLTSHGTEWALPEGFAAKLSGADYLKVDASTAGFTKEMDYTVELWFKAEAGQTNATIIGAGSGETGSAKPDYGFSIGFDADGKLAYTNNEVKTIVEGEYRDNNWHHFAFSVDRAKGKGQIYIDGNLTNYIDAATIGGITNDYIYVGARGWYDKNNVVNLIVDNYFKGEVDDIRFWELYKNEKMVRDNNNVKLTGTELGLVHYYPFDYYFEYQGLQYVDFTDLDKRISHTANPETDKFEVVGGTIDNVKSSDIAPLKDFGPIDDLDFDFVVNNDALIITLKEQEYKIAKTIITFTVYDVRDLNGNSILSPITWSAYIDRNQLRWETDRLDISKAEYEPYEFTVKAVNNGGAVRNYTITNAPSWLTVTPSRGTLQPKAYDIITFTIDEGLNTGTYNEVVYLVNDEGVAEPLQLNITVQGEKPEWVVDASKYKYDMVVFGKVRFDNIFSADKNDMLAAFDKRTKECIGVTNSYYDKKFDMWYALLTIYSNAQTINAADLEFRTWDASTGKVYKATADRIIAFKADGIIGDVDDPVIFDGKEVFYQNIPLSNGWNWVSFNLKPENSDLKSVLEQGKWTGDDQIKNRNEFYAYSATSGNWTSSTGQAIALNNTSMYKLHSTGEQLLQISGSAVDTKTTPIEIIGGGYWNYIGYLPQVNTTVKEALAGYDAQKGDIVKSQTTFAMYSRNEWVGTLGYMEANKGYMLYRGAEGNTSFIYPKGSASLSRRAKSAFAEDANLGYADNMTLVATADILQPNDIITAYINGEVRGEGKYIAGNDDQTLNFITVQGAEQGANIRFDLQRNAQVIGSSYNQLQYANNAAAGTIDEPFVLDFGIKEQNVTLYPNPFVNDLLVEVFASEGAVITLSVQDILGRTVLNGISQTATGEFTQITLNGASLATGIYLLKVSVDGEVSTYKIEKN
ncbi:MAG: T9SS type A sorting domain-containing protein, partial [Prevotellaceae bacterium]|nr:T9SS type A sorting domain-containing protein [Prevotellaceae bacterium]